MRFLGGMTSKIEFEQNWRYRYVLYYGKRRKPSIHTFLHASPDSEVKTGLFRIRQIFIALEYEHVY